MQHESNFLFILLSCAFQNNLEDKLILQQTSRSTINSLMSPNIYQRGLSEIMAQVTNGLQKVPGSVLFDMLTPAPCEQTAKAKS